MGAPRSGIVPGLWENISLIFSHFIIVNTILSLIHLFQSQNGSHCQTSRRIKTGMRAPGLVQKQAWRGPGASGAGADAAIDAVPGPGGPGPEQRGGWAGPQTGMFSYGDEKPGECQEITCHANGPEHHLPKTSRK